MGIGIGINQAKELLEKGIAQAEEIIKEPSKVDELLVQFEDKLKEVPVIGESLSNSSSTFERRDPKIYRSSPEHHYNNY